MVFYSLTARQQPDDYSALINDGFGRYACTMPALNCDKCGHRWLGQRAVPLVCSAAIRNMVYSGNRLLSPDQFAFLSKKICNIIDVDGKHIKFRPGDQFSPFIFSVIKDFERKVFSPVGGRLIIHADIKNAMIHAGLVGIQFLPTIAIKLNHDAARPARIDDFYDQVSAVIENYSEASYSYSDYYMIFSEATIDPPVATLKGYRCSYCDYQEISMDNVHSIDHNNNDLDCVEVCNANMLFFSQRALDVLKNDH